MTPPATPQVHLNLDELVGDVFWHRPASTCPCGPVEIPGEGWRHVWVGVDVYRDPIDRFDMHLGIPDDEQHLHTCSRQCRCRPRFAPLASTVAAPNQRPVGWMHRPMTAAATSARAAG